VVEAGQSQDAVTYFAPLRVGMLTRGLEPLAQEFTIGGDVVHDSELHRS
jgi:hypothetical protein